MKTYGVEFDYSEWEDSCSHKGSPRGFGSWVFSTDRNPHWDSESECRIDNLVIGSTYVWINQSTFIAAKKQAAKVAKERGWDLLFVLP